LFDSCITGIPKCSRKCSDCSESLHHWFELTLDPDRVDEGDPEKARADEIIADWLRWTAEDPRGAPVCPIVWVCQHCDFWMRYIQDCDVCDGPADAASYCLSHKEHHGFFDEAAGEGEL
jgi:hypothetical protein